MMIVAFLLAGQASLVDRADAANLAYVQCLFAVSRNASEANASVAEFERNLASACLLEERSIAQLGAKIFKLRGEVGAEAKAAQLARNARRGVVETYRNTLALKPELRRVAEICKQRPEACRD